MVTQYDAIGGKYHGIKATPVGRLEHYNMYLAVQPFVKHAKVLDLACGTGFYSRKAVEWGAASVVGVDISSSMVEFARESLTEEEVKHVKFLVGDGGKPVQYPGGPFDVVTASWLLNYARDKDQATQMFKNIYLNLKPGGVFISILPHMTDDVDDWIHKIETVQNGRYNVSVFLKEKITDGIAQHSKLYTDADVAPVEVDTYHLKQNIYIQSARGAGMQGRFDVLDIHFPNMADLGENFWRGYLETPYFSVIRVEK